MSNIDGFVQINDHEKFVGSTVHITENGVLYPDLVIKKVTSESIYTPGKSFERWDCEVYLVERFDNEYQVGDVVRVIELHEYELINSVKGIIMKINHEQDGVTNIHLVIPETTDEVATIKREHSEGASHEYIEGVAIFAGLWDTNAG